jgi:rSAM/selenodomain-associated transferase 1
VPDGQTVEPECVIVFLRSPEPGSVKTRLARTLGAGAATELYRCFVSDLMAMLKRNGSPLHIFYTPADAADRIAEWIGPGHRLTAQRGADLGLRMANAFREVFAQGARRALLVGTDLPDLPAQRIFAGFSSLAGAPAVIAPTFDGGYCLIGFRAESFIGEVFEDPPWGTGGVLPATLAALRRCSAVPRVLAPWPDIDTVDDLAALSQRLRKSAAAAPATAACLAALFAGERDANRPTRAAKFD